MEKIRDYSVILKWCISLFLLSISFILPSCGKNDPVEPVKNQNEDEYLFIEMGAHITGKPIGQTVVFLELLFFEYVFNPYYRIVTDEDVLSRIHKEDKYLVGIYNSLGGDYGRGMSNLMKTFNEYPHCDTIIYTLDRVKSIIISKILSDGTIEFIFNDEVINLPVGSKYEVTETRKDVVMNYPFRPQKYEYIQEFYSIINWGFIKKKNVIK
jgi:hypothetical protein